MSIASILKRTVVLGAVGAVAFGAKAAHAQLNVAGTTTGAFAGTTTGLTYTPGAFNVTTVFGAASIGNTGGTNNLGTFSLATASPATAINGTFTLSVNFTSPTGVSPNPLVQTATVTGSVAATGTGGVFIDFNNTPQMLTFTQGQGGSFLFAIDDVNISSGGSGVELTGRITGVNIIPEAGTLSLLSTGLLGIGGIALRRRKPAAA